VIGFMERSATVEGIRYPWREYLLYESRRGFRWLVEAKGHWSFVEPVNVADVRGGSGTTRASYHNQHFKHFQSSRATVDHVLGEFYWAVAQGDTTATADYVAPPHMLSKESDGHELHWSFATYKPPDEIWKAFGLKSRPPRPAGIAPNQPSPHRRAVRALFLHALPILGVLFLLFIGLAITGGRTVHQQSFTIPADALPGAVESALFSEPFRVEGQGNLQVRVSAPVSNSWLYLDSALIEEETGDIVSFDSEVSYYFGRSGGESWSEGGTTTKRYLGSIPPGQYVLRFAPKWERGKRPSGFEVTLRRRVARFSHFLLAALALLAWPLMTGWRQFRFEMQRWSESDHPWSSEE
jgi:hypothetical protein